MLPHVADNDLERDILPFALNADVPWAMTAHILYTALDADCPATLSARIIEHVIRGQIGFKGVLVTDDLAMGALTGSPAARALAALQAGCDVALYCSGEFEATTALLVRLSANDPVGHPSACRGTSHGGAAPRGARHRCAGSRARPAARVNNTVFHILLAVLPAIVAITLHEAAHGYAAWALGDDTAKLEGRLSLNPLAHVDRVGTLLLPGFLILFQLITLGRVSFLFGWAKPVPVAAWKFDNPRRGMMLVAAAGPLMNFFLAWIGALVLHPILAMADDESAGAFASGAVGGAIPTVLALLAQYFILSNLVLGLFNLLPIPPLDGGRIAVGLLPLPLAKVWARFERAGILIVVLLVFLLPRALAEFDIAFNPVGDALDAVIPWAMHVILSLAGFSGEAGDVLGI